MIKVLGRSSSSNVQKVLWCAGELGLEVIHEPEYGGPFGNTDTAEYLGMNPNGLVPTMIHDGFILWESNAIVRYLAASFGDGGLWPTDIQTRAVADKWMEWHTSTLGEVSFPAFYELVRKPPAQRSQATIDASVAAAAPVFAIMNVELEGRSHLLGEELSMADIVYGSTIHRWMTIPIDRQPMPNVEAWYARMLERPAYQKYVAIPLS
jgi:glutathione S-transferase